jgi:hypothetical protein
MSQVAKIDPSSATLRELADATQHIVQGITAAEIKFNKKLLSLHPFSQVLNFYIPRGNEMSIHNGFLSLYRWGAAHFLTNAEYFEAQGFKAGRFSHQMYVCPHRQEDVKTTMDVTGRAVTVDDPTFSEMVAALKAFPPAAYREANNRITEIIHKYIIEGATSINQLEPFGAIIFLQGSIIWNLAKVCIDSAEEIRNIVHAVEKLPLTNRQQVATFQKEAIFALTMQEKSKLVPMGYFDSNFWYNSLTGWLTFAESNLSEPHKSRVNRTVDSLMCELDAKTSLQRDATFGIMRDTFKTNMNGLPQVDGQDIGIPPPQLALVASTAQVPYGQKRKNLQQAQPSTPEALALLLKGQGDLKAEMGAMREILKNLSAGQTGNNPNNPKRARTQQENGKIVKAQALAATMVRKAQGKSAQQVRIAKELPTMMDSSESQASEEEVIYANFAAPAYMPPQQQLISIYGPAPGRTVVYSSRLQPTMSDPYGFDRPRPGGPTQTSYGGLSQRSLEEDRASSTSKDSLTTNARLLSVKDADDHFAKASCTSKFNGAYISLDKRILDLATSNDEEDTLECTGFSTTFKTADSVQQGQVREDDQETPKTAGMCIPSFTVTDDTPDISKPQTRNRTRMDGYALPEPVLPSDDDDAMGDGTSYTIRQPEPSSDQEMDDEQAQIACKKRTPAAPRRKQAATPKNNGIEPLTPGATEEQARHAYMLRNSRPLTAAGRITRMTPLQEFNSFIDAYNGEPPAAKTTSSHVPFGQHEGDM